MPDHAGSDPGPGVLRRARLPDAPLLLGKAPVCGVPAEGARAFTRSPPAMSSSPIQICVSKCPDRYLTYLGAYNSRTPGELEYYRHFCVPEFKNLQKVGCRERGVGVAPPAPARSAFPRTLGNSCPKR